MVEICQAILPLFEVLLLLLFPAFEGLHDNTKFVIIRCTQQNVNRL